ncbi:MAG: aminoacyl-tRNA hydrolase [Flavobacteriales bacterium]|nr:aminoacyl-tRNA hydrolase [Flavobacteriales bacterium]
MNFEAILKEVTFTAVRSSGAGGQHVNKVSSKIQLRWEVSKSSCFSEVEKERILLKVASLINEEGVLRISSQNSRSQFSNKKDAIQKFFTILENAFKEPKKRVATKVPKAVKEKRLQSKKRISELKNSRKKNF